MERPLLILLMISLSSCFDNPNLSQIDKAAVKMNDTTTLSLRENFKETTVTLFGDSSYKLTVRLFDTTNDYDTDQYNSVLIFRRLNRNEKEVIFQDSMFCMYPDIDFQDFNNDKVKDVLVFYSTGARANPTYHLYLTDLINHDLIRVNGFEELPNPDLDTTHNIITSISLAGSNYYSFYQINSRNILINLGHGYEDNPNDSTLYERTIRQILKEQN